MKELLIYLISISSFTLTQCETGLNGYVEFYSNGENKVFICENYKRQQNEIILHELGHILYYRKLNEKQKQIIRDRYNSTTKFINDYAAVDEEEYFSEMFTYYVIKTLGDGVIETVEFDRINGE